MSSNIISAAVIDKSPGGTRQNKSFMKILFLDRNLSFNIKESGHSLSGPLSSRRRYRREHLSQTDARTRPGFCVGLGQARISQDVPNMTHVQTEVKLTNPRGLFFALKQTDQHTTLKHAQVSTGSVKSHLWHVKDKC